MYKFNRFVGFVDGWWLVIKPTDPTAAQQLSQFVGQGSIQFHMQALLNGQTICVNRAGGYHTLTDKHQVVETIETNQFQFPISR
jgi:hypothetical protein